MHPWLIRNLIFPAHEKLVARPTLNYASALERSQWLTRDEIELMQRKKLKALLQLANQHCPWHRRRIQESKIPIEKGELPSLQDLQRLPLMEKKDAQANRDSMAWLQVPGGAFPYNTGGSSGEPLIFYFGRWRQASDAAGRIRARSWWNVGLGDREVYLWGAPVELNKTDRIKKLRDRMMNQLMLNAFSMSAETMEQYLAAIEAYNPKCIYGYASSIVLLAQFARSREKSMRLPDLKVVCTTGEPLDPGQRQIIQDVFHVPVANEFGSRDIGFTAHESPEQQMLLISESIILEVLDSDGRAVKAGETGEAVMTGLCSQAQPFIRYRTGDVVTATEETCTAGRGLHVLGEVLGRSTDFIIRQDGTIMHALSLIYVLRSIPGVEAFKIIQHSLSDLEVQVVPNLSWQDEHEAAIEQGLKQWLGNEVRIAIHRHSHIPPESSGKHRYVVSRVPLPSELTH